MNDKNDGTVIGKVALRGINSYDVYFKGIVYPKLKFHPFASGRHANRGSGDILQSAFWSFTGRIPPEGR